MVTVANAPETTKPWTRMPGTYEDGTVIKLLPPNRRQDSTYILVGGMHREQTARFIVAASEMLALLPHVPHSRKPELHKLIGQVAGCPGCDAQALLALLIPAKAT